MVNPLNTLKSQEYRVHLLLTSSNLAELYVYDELKKVCNATVESVVDVNTASEFKGMLELVNIQPNLSDMWLFVLKFSKLKSLIKKSLGVFLSESSVFLINVDNYKDFKEVKGMFKENNILINELYLNTIKRFQVFDLLSPFKLSQVVKDFVATSYYETPEKVFQLRNELIQGAVVKEPKDVIRLCGESQSSIQKIVMQLLSDAPKTDVFMKRSFKKRVEALKSLCDTFTPLTTYNYIRSSIRDVLYIKMLYLEGEIYDRIYDLPENFDEKKLSRYSFYLSRISNDISYDRILYLYIEMWSCGRWLSDMDSVSFLYRYYTKLIRNGENCGGNISELLISRQS